MKDIFAVIRTFGPSWQPSAPLEQQREWNAHASFMNNLKRDGFIVLGGPLEDTRDVLLVVRADSAEQVDERFSTDPWSHLDLLRIKQVSRWTLRLGSLP